MSPVGDFRSLYIFHIVPFNSPFFLLYISTLSHIKKLNANISIYFNDSINFDVNIYIFFAKKQTDLNQPAKLDEVEKRIHFK